jgi:hypothetical protein
MLTVKKIVLKSILKFGSLLRELFRVLGKIMLPPLRIIGKVFVPLFLFI